MVEVLRRTFGGLQLAAYNALSAAAALVLFPFWALRERSYLRVLERYGRVPPAIRRAADFRGSLWFHAASVGEVGVLARVIPHLAALSPDLPVVISTVTSTGRERALQLLGEQAGVVHLPLDAPFIVGRVVRSLHPQVMVIAETELWPNLLRALHAYGTPVVLVNGRLSERSFRRYRLARPGIGPLLGRLDALCVKSEGDRRRFIALGARPDVVHVVGDLKSEPIPGIETASMGERRRRLGLPEERPIFTAGSTREGEEGTILRAFARTLERHPDLLLVIAPRHLSRTEAVERLIASEGLSCLRRTVVGRRTPEGASVLLLDTIGELERVFAASDLAFVGGSLAPLGGHNLLEPAMYGVPVLFGPHTGETGGADAVLLDAGGGFRVEDVPSLVAALDALLSDERRRSAAGERARAAVRRSRGALDQIVRHYRRVLGLERGPVPAVRADRGSRGPRAEDEPQ